MQVKEKIVDGLRVFRMPASVPPAVGRWKYNANNTLAYFDATGREWYEVDLDRCRDARATLDCVVQVAQKGYWATPEVIGLLVLALDERLRLQQTQCGMGMCSDV
jgi:hypothetical protein